MKDCILCAIQQGALPAVKVYDDAQCMVIMDRFPFRPGHALVVPKQHGQYLADHPAEILAHLWQVAQRIGQAQRQGPLQAKAYHLLVNDGKAANQHIPHLHLHVIPRYAGDSWRLTLNALTRFYNPWQYYRWLPRLQRHADLIQQGLAESP